MRFHCLRPVVRVIRLGFWLVVLLILVVLALSGMGFWLIRIGALLSRMSIDVAVRGSRRVVCVLPLMLAGRGLCRAGRHGCIWIAVVPGVGGMKGRLISGLAEGLIGRLAGGVAQGLISRFVSGLIGRFASGLTSGHVRIVGRIPVTVIDRGIDGVDIGKCLHARRCGMEYRSAIPIVAGRRCIDPRTIDRECASAAVPAGCIAFTHGDRPKLGAGDPGNFTRIGAARIVVDGNPVIVDDGRVIVGIIHDRSVVDDGGIVDDGDVLLLVDVVVIDMRAGHILMRNE